MPQITTAAVKLIGAADLSEAQIDDVLKLVAKGISTEAAITNVQQKGVNAIGLVQARGTEARRLLEAKADAIPRLERALKLETDATTAKKAQDLFRIASKAVSKTALNSALIGSSTEVRDLATSIFEENIATRVRGAVEPLNFDPVIADAATAELKSTGRAPDARTLDPFKRANKQLLSFEKQLSGLRTGILGGVDQGAKLEEARTLAAGKEFSKLDKLAAGLGKENRSARFGRGLKGAGIGGVAALILPLIAKGIFGKKDQGVDPGLQAQILSQLQGGSAGDPQAADARQLMNISRMLSIFKTLQAITGLQNAGPPAPTGFV